MDHSPSESVDNVTSPFPALVPVTDVAPCFAAVILIVEPVSAFDIVISGVLSLVIRSVFDPEFDESLREIDRTPDAATVYALVLGAAAFPAVSVEE